MATKHGVSSIAMALAGKTDSLDIPKPRDAGKDSFAAVVAKSMHRTGYPAMLPTPPNSISPTLPPQGFNARGNYSRSPTSDPLNVDSDIDLQDAVDHANSQDQPQHAGPASQTLNLGSSGAITPGMLAKHHLPDILLNHGPLAIRHVMGYLTTSVPGFSGIPPAKARRLVVGALEGRGGEGGGPDGDVEFEKVGWGRWDAKRRGQPPRNRDHVVSPPTSVPSSYSAQRLQPPHNTPWADPSSPYGTSMAGDSAVFSHSEVEYGEQGDVTMHEADKMSLDLEDHGYCSSSEAPDDDFDDVGDGDVTDEEDWAQIGAAALRARSLQNASGGGPFFNHHLAAQPKRRDHGPSPSALAQSPVGIPIQHNGFSLPNGVGDMNERAAVEALLSLGSM
ncbi:DNA-binding proteins Bright/BRCAA1/RBP1 and proteins containing BRIGHT domain [Arachnomyces sp. PD_36]|nr:DNA-binding proteins Bright/BRCAA1/RBP1 and proteins containing BRIGHT domain [Arachnomyces sp. PD_36]